MKKRLEANFVNTSFEASFEPITKEKVVLYIGYIDDYNSTISYRFDNCVELANFLALYRKHVEDIHLLEFSILFEEQDIEKGDQ